MLNEQMESRLYIELRLYFAFIFFCLVNVTSGSSQSIRFTTKSLHSLQVKTNAFNKWATQALPACKHLALSWQQYERESSHVVWRQSYQRHATATNANTAQEYSFNETERNLAFVACSTKIKSAIFLQRQENLNHQTTCFNNTNISVLFIKTLKTVVLPGKKNNVDKSFLIGKRYVAHQLSCAALQYYIYYKGRSESNATHLISCSIHLNNIWFLNQIIDW